MAKADGATKAQIDKVKEKLPSVDVDSRLVTLETELRRLNDELLLGKQTQVEATDLLTEIYGKIDYEGIPLPPDVMAMFKGKETWIWAITFHAMLSSLFNNPVVMSNEQQCRDATMMAFRAVGYFVEELHKKCDTS